MRLGAESPRRRALDRWIRDKYELRQYSPRRVRCRWLLRPPADVRACRNCAPPDGKVQPAAAAAAAAPPVPPPKPRDSFMVEVYKILKSLMKNIKRLVIHLGTDDE